MEMEYKQTKADDDDDDADDEFVSFRLERLLPSLSHPYIQPHTQINLPF
jgi:hypothetical protein